MHPPKALMPQLCSPNCIYKSLSHPDCFVFWAISMLQQIHKVSCADLFPLSNTHSFASVGHDPIRDLIQFRNNKNV